ncbi:MAG TPA: ThuA domain-containing protein [Solirubrobacter sp.]
MLSVKTKSVCWKAKRITRPLLLLVVLSICTACGGEPAAQAGPKPFRVLVFTKTTGYRHDSIPSGVAAIKRLAARHSFSVDTTADAAKFTTRSLERYDAVVFLSTTGTPIKSDKQRSAFVSYIRRGGGYLGIHAASDTRGDWPWYEGLVGARFKRHDRGLSSRRVQIVDPATAATRALPNPWVRTDEWYEFRSAPAAHVLAALDQTRPLAWCHRYDGGRSVYTAMGHTKQSYAEPRFLAHLLGALEMAAGRARFDCAD